jgi:hypothetical protein
LRSDEVIYQIIYSSQAKVPMSMAGLEEILVDARAANEKRQVTGVLVYVDGVFLQILEGEEAVIRGLVQSISADSRHGDLKVFYERQVSHRTFPDWRMAYLSATPQQMAVWAGLEGTAPSIDWVLEGIQRNPKQVPQVVDRLLRALVP